MKGRVLGAVVSLTAVVAAMLTASPPPEAVATAPGCNGRIAFMRPDANGSRQRFVSASPMTEHQPDWLPLRSHHCR
ncbi:hypothetical protein [Kribbella sp. DT2]|uniref:hypothetical protein n=1 Tax=Kribbella sp. DT2 TaxID=3393427 RepID=UPI003CF35687